MKLDNQQKGFSLIETLIYVVIFTMFVSALTSFTGTMNSARLHTQTQLEVGYQGSQAIRTITHTIRNANTIDSPAMSISSPSLTVVSILTGTTTFSETDGVLYITENANPPIALTNNQVEVTDLVFSNFSTTSTPGVIQVSFTLSNSASSTRASEQYSADFYGTAAIR